MQLHLNPGGGLHLVRQVSAGEVHLNSGVHALSVVLCPNRGARSFAPRRLADIDDTALGDIITDAPDILLLGTGRTIRFPAVSMRASLLAKRIGLEVMDNAACARTFNVLAGESRSVMAIFLAEDAA